MTLGRSTSGAIKIKTDDGFRAVSCGCCDTGCLQYRLYDSSLYEVKYDFNDLPDLIDVTIVGGADEYTAGERFTLSKNSTATNGFFTPLYIESGFFDIDFEEEGIVFYRGGLAVFIETRFGRVKRWTQAKYSQKSSGEWFENDYQWGRQRFLIQNQNNNEDFTNARVLDFFANSYSVSDSSSSVTVVRATSPDTQWGGEYPDYSSEDIPLLFCETEPDFFEPYFSPGLWSGSGARLFFSDIRDFDTGEIIETDCVWKIKIGSDVYVKSGDQNTPVGSYAGGFTVS